MPDYQSANILNQFIGNIIRQRRQTLRYTQLELASILKITLKHIQEYEHGKRAVELSHLWRLSSLLDMPLEHFFPPSEDKNLPVACYEDTIVLDGVTEIFNLPGLMKHPDTLRLIEAFYKIPNRCLAAYIYDLILFMAESTC